MKDLLSAVKALGAVGGLLMAVGCSSVVVAPISEIQQNEGVSYNHSQNAATQSYPKPYKAEHKSEHNQAKSTAPVANPDSSVVHVVQPGETVYRIALNYGLTTDALMRLNNMTDPRQLQLGQVLVLREGEVEPTKAANSTNPAKPARTPKITKSTATPTPSKTEAVAKSALASAPATASMGENEWLWPAEGSIIRKFSSSTHGIDIAGNIGDKVRAAAAGTVYYVGDSFRGFGNLVIIDHGKEIMSAYAHNNEVLVQKGQQVKAGQVIATMGQSDAKSPRLHFEIRKYGKPIDPTLYLRAR